LTFAAQQPAALICAAPVYDESAPKSRLHGRKIMNFWCVVNTLSHRIKDAMCGFRIYPLEGIVPLLSRTKNRRMGFDAEILILAVRAGLEIKWLDLAVRYEAGGVSHFAPFRDNFGISLMHARLFCGLPLWLAKRALKRACDKFKKRGLQDVSQQSANEILQGLAGQNLCSGARRDSRKGAEEEIDGGADEKAGTEKCGDNAAAQSSQAENSAQSSLVKVSSQHAAGKDGRDG